MLILCSAARGCAEWDSEVRACERLGVRCIAKALRPCGL